MHNLGCFLLQKMKIEPEMVHICVFQTEQKNRGPHGQLQSSPFFPCVLNGDSKLQSCEELAVLMKSLQFKELVVHMG